MRTSDFITKHDFRTTTKRIPSRPTMADGWGEDARHWIVRLHKPADPKNVHNTTWPSLEVTFTQGAAHTTPPTTADVLNCLRSDFSGVIHGETFEDFADEFGYETDSRKAERIYRECKRQLEAFRLAFGYALTEELVESEED